MRGGLSGVGGESCIEGLGRADCRGRRGTHGTLRLDLAVHNDLSVSVEPRQATSLLELAHHFALLLLGGVTASLFVAALLKATRGTPGHLGSGDKTHEP